MTDDNKKEVMAAEVEDTAADEEVSTDEMIIIKEHPLEAGEKAFAIILLIVGLVAFALSLELWGRMKEPKISSAAAVPLFVSGLWSLMALLTVIENIKLTTPLSGMARGLEKFRKAIAYAVPFNVGVMVGMILVYCVLLLFGVSFYVATPLFLYGAMCFLTRKDYVKNILWTAIVMAFIVVVFRMLFSVVFP